MTRIKAAAALGLFLVAAAGADPARHDAGYFRGGPERSGDFPTARLPSKPAVLWKVEAVTGFGTPIVSGGVVFVGDSNGALLALKAETGAILWRDDVPGRRVAEAPCAAGDLVYVSSDQGLSALSRDEGLSRWHYPIAGGAGESSPLVVAGLAVVAGYDGFVHAVDAKTGQPAWKHDLAGDALDSPPGFDQKRAVIAGNAARPMTAASDGSTVFVPVFDQSRVVAVDLKTGERRWSYQTKGWCHAEPTVTGDAVYLTSQDRNLYRLDKATGRVAWTFPTRWRVESGTAVRGGGVYFGSCDGFFYRVDAGTGKAVWSFQTPKGGDGKHHPIYSSPIVTEDAVCFGSFDGYLYALKTATGEVAWKVRPVDGAQVDSSPCTDGRRVFFSVRADFENRGANAIAAVGEAAKD